MTKLGDIKPASALRPAKFPDLPCTVEGCDRGSCSRSRQICQYHYDRQRLEGKLGEKKSPNYFRHLEINGFKVCNTCQENLPVEKFRKYSNNSKMAGYRMADCRRCQYVKYRMPKKYDGTGRVSRNPREVARKTHPTNKDPEMQSKLESYKMARGCLDCGYQEHPAALEFDHLEGTEKLFNISEKLSKKSPEVIWAEVAKCEVVCRRCHQLRTKSRRVKVSYPTALDAAKEGEPSRICTTCLINLPINKFKPSQQGRPVCNRCLYVDNLRPTYEKRRDEIHKFQLERGCADCGYNKSAYALEFDHLPEFKKEFNIALKIGVYSQKRVWAEIAKCEVVCSNCHSIRTYTRVKERQARRAQELLGGES